MAAKILLVEDDKSLREIYGVRLMAEGYDIVSASDGEQALAVAIKERPSLIITDVMMPKISGFDMLDILRSTTETKDIKVIMMTALSSDDQRQRGERMGADRYLVKSQVGIEDVVRTVHDVLGDASAKAAPAVTPTVPASMPPVAPISTPQPNPAPTAVNNPMPSPVPLAAVQPVSIPVAPQTVVTPQPAPVAPDPMPMHSSTTPEPPSSKQRIIQPINDITAKVNINELLDRELAKEAGLDMLSRPQVATTEQEKAEVQNQIAAAEQAPIAPAPATPVAPAAPAMQMPVNNVAPVPSSSPELESGTGARPAPPTPSAPARPEAPLQTPPRPVPSSGQQPEPGTGARPVPS